MRGILLPVLLLITIIAGGWIWYAWYCPYTVRVKVELIPRCTMPPEGDEDSPFAGEARDPADLLDEGLHLFSCGEEDRAVVCFERYLRMVKSRPPVRPVSSTSSKEPSSAGRSVPASAVPAGAGEPRPSAAGRGERREQPVTMPPDVRPVPRKADLTELRTSIRRLGGRLMRIAAPEESKEEVFAMLVEAYEKIEQGRDEGLKDLERTIRRRIEELERIYGTGDSR